MAAHLKNQEPAMSTPSAVPADLAIQADHNLAAATRIHHRWQAGARLHEQGGVMLHQGSLPIPAPFMNTVMRLDGKVPASEVLQHARDFFGGSSNPFAPVLFMRRDADIASLLATEGFTLQADLALMLTEQPSVATPLPEGWRLQLVEGRAQTPGMAAPDLPGFVDCCAQAYASLGLPAFMTPFFFSRAEQVLTPEVSLVLARRGDEPPAGAAMVLHTGDMAGLYWVATRPEARGQGLAAACTVAATNLALERGAKAVALQASPMGDPIYRRLGWREYDRLQRWSS
jgi:GNAT superfamily N-acetyltransferase